ncbi:uncharacterized protein BDV14DRAFT_183461 [Aspergillus stella-maris]|uniref:uncharacterized protein n=1 Tax=Aspergillus stella-maris TaxID=1810926 RepID=UPI003CCE0D82
MEKGKGSLQQTGVSVNPWDKILEVESAGFCRRVGSVWCIPCGSATTWLRDGSYGSIPTPLVLKGKVTPEALPVCLVAWSLN